MTAMITHAFVRSLKDRLVIAQREFEVAKYIDSYERMKRERGYWAEEIQTLKTQIESAEEELRKREDAR